MSVQFCFLGLRYPKRVIQHESRLAWQLSKGNPGDTFTGCWLTFLFDNVVHLSSHQRLISVSNQKKKKKKTTISLRRRSFHLSFSSLVSVSVWLLPQLCNCLILMIYFFFFFFFFSFGTLLFMHAKAQKLPAGSNLLVGRSLIISPILKLCRLLFSLPALPSLSWGVYLKKKILFYLRSNQ